MPKKIIALITACGRGSRFGSEGIPKQYHSLAGIAILRHSILAFLNHPKVDDVICVINQEDVKLYEEAVAGLDLLNPVFGGATRQISVRHGLEAIAEHNPSLVLIHDAVRPFVSKQIISGVLEKLETHQAVIPAVAVEDTIKKYSDGKIEWTLERQDLWRAQTPQGFVYDDIIHSHQAFKDLNFTDDAALNEYAGIPVAIIPGSQNNFKITTKDDYKRAKQMSSIINEKIKEEIRCGIGYDVHAFRKKLAKEDKFIKICGVNVEFDKKIKAHSDGDVAIHALIDAMLGAVGAGDIGQHFPDNDDKWKGEDSAKMLDHTSHVLKKKSATLINVDLIIICEEPKISNLRNKMQKKLAEILRIKEDRINVKATTTEKLGFLGRGEGIAAKAIVSVKIATFDE
jgi:2-C-methyl-D-erythritol 4-phosphate cytidylyltransferase/2-C-methyl-D-erythritol 2,4-cyclodiphosphate synthase